MSIFKSSQKEDDESMNKLERYSLPKSHKICIFGTGEQGKRTCFLHFQDTADEFDKLIILQNIVEEFIDFLKLIINQNLVPHLFSRDYIQQFYKNLSEVYLNCYDVNSISKEHFLEIIEIWKDNRIKEFFIENMYQFGDGTIYLLDHLEYYLMKDFIPTSQDILHTRVKTFGINSVNINARSCKIFLTGGQKLERKKWNKLFPETDCIIWVVSLNDFMKLSEDKTMNRMLESLSVYESVVNDPLLVEKKIILYLNKIDRFSELIDRKESISKIFSDYQGKNTYEDEIEFIFEKFKSKTTTPERLHCFLTQGTNEKLMKRVIKETFNIYFKGGNKQYFKEYPKLYFPRKGIELILKQDYDIHFNFEI